MKPEELRIGNYVYPFDDGHLCTDKEIFNDRIKVTPKDFENTEHLYPILLTEEWLLKFGFVKLTDSKDGFKNTSYTYTKGISFIVYFDGVRLSTNFWIGNEKRYVHQLQNLFFVLTGEELIIK